MELSTEISTEVSTELLRKPTSFYRPRTIGIRPRAQLLRDLIPRKRIKNVCHGTQTMMTAKLTQGSQAFPPVHAGQKRIICLLC